MSREILCPRCQGRIVIDKPSPTAIWTCPHCQGQFTLGAPPPTPTPQVATGQIVQQAKTVFDWLKTGVSTFVDTDREERTDRQADQLHNELGRLRDKFNLAAGRQTLGIQDKDVEYVAEKVFTRLLLRGWDDGKLTEAEKGTLRWAAKSLQLPDNKVAELNWSLGRAAFEKLLAAALVDGHVDDSELKELTQTAASLNTTVGSLVRTYFQREGERFLRSVFMTIIHDGRISGEEWNRLIQTTTRLGFTQDELLASVEMQSRAFVEHVLADAKADCQLSSQEDQTLSWLLQQLRLPLEFRSYVEAELAELRLFNDIAKGRLPSLIAPLNLGFRAGEVLHYQGPAQMSVDRTRRKTAVTDVHLGTIAVTDARLIFSSSTKSITLNHRNIVEHHLERDGVEIRPASKGSMIFYFGEKTQLAYAIYATAVGRANQTIMAQLEGPPTRHIPRDVRQRVWQRYGGRCAECGSNQYLEYDHVIPHAKGGGNTDANVQLLCRGCNLKKSDHV